MSANPLKAILDLYREVMQTMLTAEERSKIKIVIAEKPRGAIDLEGPEELKAKITQAVIAKLKKPDDRN